MATNYDDMKLADLYVEAKRLGVTGHKKMKKVELAKAMDFHVVNSWRYRARPLSRCFTHRVRLCQPPTRRQDRARSRMPHSISRVSLKSPG